MFVFPGYGIDQSRIDVEEVGPNFVMATSICFLETQHAVRDSEGSMHTDLSFYIYMMLSDGGGVCGSADSDFRQAKTRPTEERCIAFVIHNLMLYFFA